MREGQGDVVQVSRGRESAIGGEEGVGCLDTGGLVMRVVIFLLHCDFWSVGLNWMK